MPRTPISPGALALALALALAAGCAPGDGPAERAVAASERTWDAARERARAIAPERAARIEHGIARARAALEAGDWIGALAATQDLPAQIARLSAEVDSQSRARDAAWDHTNAALGEGLQQVDAGIERLAALRRRPAGVSAADVARARAELRAARVAWTQAVSARGEGRWNDAMARAGEARLRARRALDAVALPAVAALATPRAAAR